MFYKQFDFLRIDRAEYGASWTLSFLVKDSENARDIDHLKKCYVMLKCYPDAGISNWACGIKKLLCTNGFGYVWESQSVMNEKHFLASLTQRFKDQHLQKWFERINLSFKLITYSGFKTKYEHELYLNCITNRKHRRIIAQFRISAHDFEIESGRYSGIDMIESVSYLEEQ